MTSRPLSASPLLLRFARALGLTGLAGMTMASGPCGTCDPIEHACFEQADLVKQRTSTLARLEHSRTEDADGGAGEAGAAGGITHSTGGRAAANDAGTVDYHDDPLWRTINGWQPASGCPNEFQLGALLGANGHNSGWETIESDRDGKCCYRGYERCPGGRPFLVNGLPRVAALECREGGAASSDPFTEALRQSWLADAQMEHASVASFARLSLQLLGFGAPLELVRDSQLASLDELRHAAFCFEQAAAWGSAAHPAELAMTDALAPASFAEFVASNLLEGCIGETLAAMQLAEQSRRAQSPILSTGLAAISEDEARHAELAFRVLKWCFAHDAETTRDVLGRIVAQFRPANRPSRCESNSGWSDAGRLTPYEAHGIDLQTWTSTLQPLFAALLAAPTSSSARHPAPDCESSRQRGESSSATPPNA